jgi:hypothetical protein
MIWKYRHFDRSGEPEGSAKQNLLNLIPITWYKDLSPEISGLRYSRDDDHSFGTYH